MTKKLPDIKLCIMLDVIGCLSYLVPFVGEVTDVVWAPLSGFIFYFLFGKRLGTMGGIFSIIEEILPGFDFIPTFTIAWFIRKKEMEKDKSAVGLKIIRQS